MTQDEEVAADVVAEGRVDDKLVEAPGLRQDLATLMKVKLNTFRHLSFLL